MTLESSDYDDIRLRAERRLEPLKKLRRLRLWLFINLGLFIAGVVIGENPENPIFAKITSHTGTYFDELTRQTQSYTYTTHEIYPLVLFIMVVWFFLLIAHGLHVWSAYRHERAIQREMDRETTLELERLRLQVELARYQRREDFDGDQVEQEKAKRTIQLGDDGELLTEEPAQVTRQGRR